MEAHTPVSMGSEMASSTSTTASSSRKRSKSPVIRSMERFMREMTRIQAERYQIRQDHLDKKREKIMRVQQLARESGANESNMMLWLGVLKITQNERSMDLFIAAAPEVRLKFIEHYAGESNAPREGKSSDESSDEELYRFLLDDDGSDVMMLGMLAMLLEEELEEDTIEPVVCPGPADEEPEDMEAHTPVSMGSKMTSSTSTTASSSRKKSKSPVIRNMVREMIRIQVERYQIMQNHLDKKREKIMLVQQLARESGANESNMMLWLGVLKITQNEGSMDFFIATARPEVRLKIIEHYAGESNAPSDEELYRFLLEDDGSEVMMLSMLAMLLEEELEEDTIEPVVCPGTSPVAVEKGKAKKLRVDRSNKK